MEEWRDIQGYEGMYRVSNLGNVISLKREKPCIMKPQKHNGYLHVMLSLNGVKRFVTIHRLVAVAFIPNPDNLPEVNHKDEDKTNNHVENLEWCSREYNASYGTVKERISKSNMGKKMSEKTKKLMSEHNWMTGRTGEQHPNAKAVLCYDMQGNFVKRYPSMAATEEDGFSQCCVNACCRHRSKHHKGHIFKYESEELNNAKSEK